MNRQSRVYSDQTPGKLWKCGIFLKNNFVTAKLLLMS